MKKIITFLLALAMIFCCCACSGSGNAPQTQESAAAAEQLQIGYARVNVTPDFPVGLAGYSNSETRRSDEGFLDYIYTTCVAATSGEETVLLFTIDNCAASKTTVTNIRKSVSPATGVPEEKIYVGATHSHACPDLTMKDDEAGNKYLQLFLSWCVEAAEDALKDRAPATVLAATPEFEGMNFVRHYEMEDGSYAGANFGDFSKKIVRHAAPTDPQMVLVKFDYADEAKKDVLLVNWQAHPDTGSEISRKIISASFPGPLRDTLEQKTGMRVAYFTGASGNQTIESRIPEEMHNLSWKDYGNKMGELAAGALDQLKPIEGSGIKTKHMIYDAPIDHSWDHLLDAANEVYNLWKTVSKAAGDELGKQYNFTSSYQARAIRTRAAKGETEPLEVNAFSIGGIGFTTGTYEMFSNQGLYVKEHSPFEVTFIITGNSTYIPAKESYDYRSYEADTGYYAAGTAEALAENYVKMLNDIK